MLSIDRSMHACGVLPTHIEGSVLQESRQAVERERPDRFLVDSSTVLLGRAARTHMSHHVMAYYVTLRRHRS